MRSKFGWPRPRRTSRSTPQKPQITRGFVGELGGRFPRPIQPTYRATLRDPRTYPGLLPRAVPLGVSVRTISELPNYQGFLALTGFEPLPHRSLPARGYYPANRLTCGQGQFTRINPYYRGQPRARTCPGRTSAPLPARYPGLGRYARRYPRGPRRAVRAARWYGVGSPRAWAAYRPQLRHTVCTTPLWR